MSKTSKFFRTPGLFFSDLVKKKLGMPTSGQVAATTRGAVAGPATKKAVVFKTLPQYMSEITNFAANYNVNTIKVGDESIWPYLRSHLVSQYIALNTRRNPHAAMTLTPSRVSMGGPENLPYSLRSHFSAKYDVKELEEIPDGGGVDFLFFTFTNATEQVELEGKYFFRVTDSVYECAKNVGSTQKIEIIRSNSQGIRKVKDYYHKPLLVFSPSMHTYGYSNKLEFNRHLFSAAARYLPSVEFGLESFEAVVDWEMSTRDFYVRLLKKLRPRVICVPAFHMCPPLISAARSLGISTVDIQHGIQVGWNPLYNDWNEAPAEGYKALPQYFMVWSRKEADNISRVFPWAKPLVIGHTWLARQLKHGAALPPSIAAALRQAGPKILVAMQLGTEVPDWLREIIEEAPADATILVRNHPKALKRFDSSSFGHFETKANVLCSKELDAALLVPILQATDAVISEGSSVSAEAKLFGATVFLCGETAQSNYAREVETGDYRVYSTPADFFETVSADMANGGEELKENIEKSLDLAVESLKILLNESKEFGEVNG
ncbi:hypothetical protein [Achromobacter animicus]|uniref:hypothetical protein n=1 Tax=Achromobacter animicus TaxID=1389935 RepID=UPI0028B10D3B|nr:hypothetical protein [Achromobacter animicus]